jgi:hypothetical protein
MQAFQPSQNGAGRMTGMLDKVRNEVRELQRENKSLKLQMQQLYSAMLDVSHQLLHDSVYEEEAELEGDVTGYLVESSSLEPGSEMQELQRLPSAAPVDVHSGTTSPASESEACSSGFEERETSWFEDFVEMRLTSALSDHSGNVSSHWTDTYHTQMMIVS